MQISEIGIMLVSMIHGFHVVFLFSAMVQDRIQAAGDLPTSGTSHVSKAPSPQLAHRAPTKKWGFWSFI